MNNHRELALAHLDRLQGFFTRVEGKATFLFAINLAMLGLLALNFPMKAIWSYEAGVASITVGLLAGSMWRAYRVFVPDLVPAPKRSLLYFDEIAKMTEGDFCREWRAMTDEELCRDAISQIWRNSEILKAKFDAVSKAFTWTLFSVPPWVVFLALAALRAGELSFGA